MSEHEDNLNEEPFRSLLSAANHSAPPPDREFLTRLRAQTVEVFQATGTSETTPTVASSSLRTPSGATENEHPQLTQPSAVPSPRKATRPMMFVASKLLGALTAAAAILLGFFFASRDPALADLTLGDALDATWSVPALQLEVAAEQILVRQPNKLRWQRGEGIYDIGVGSTLYKVNEHENRAVPTGSPFFHAERTQVDLLSLLGSDAAHHITQIRDLTASKRRMVEGRSLLVYETSWNIEGLGRGVSEGVEFEALVDPEKKLVHSLAVKYPPAGKQGGGGAQLLVAALDQPISDDMFTVSDTLTADGRVGKVTDVQGIVGVQPALAQRWSPVCNGLILKPRDWIRTDRRGANAVAMRLMRETDITLGPASLLEIIKPQQIRLHAGEMEIKLPADAKLELLGPNDQKLTVEGTQRFRLQDEKLVRLDSEPLWLKGFKGAVPAESIGSLVVTLPDGRNEPLTVGYHKVTVDIRDQIARTVIEESFVNRTKSRLEGVFHFPLPQDASISGFGMWIGENLVEADIVERERAREIYETILRERRDPGLLEWSGGNLFKARVFPIEPHSEKRIKIVYTQVLPLRGNSYRYSYALQSDLLRLHPLRELSLDVNVHSVLPLAKVSSPSHSVRTSQAANSARVQFSAQEHTPNRDFEVLVELDSQQRDVVLVPHRRGEDGYFMLQLIPPATNGQWQREVLENGEPMNLLILADTSASMDKAARASQAQFIATLLLSLSPKDRVNLAGCDVNCDWLFETPQPPETKQIEAMRDFLAKRRSLGWTDLDKAFASAMEQGRLHAARSESSGNAKVVLPTTHVVYIGDGIVTSGDADPHAFVRRLKEAYDDRGIFHAVTLGSTFEPAVVNAFASLGGGSLRRISTEQGPQAVALELLQEMTQPALRDLKVEFRGIRTARVYPERLPNLVPGTQQILLGRYLPEGTDQVGEVVVTGRQGGKEVRFTTPVRLRETRPDGKAAESHDDGNSFIPRLWARMHIESLLSQGPSESLKDEIIGLSEEFHIMTPYTSLLVLETDEDRERFKVSRRFQMRDGERFFAQGRDNAQFELAHQQMKLAGDWRLELRRAVLAQFAAQGRDPRLFQMWHERGRQLGFPAGMAGYGGGGPASGPVSSTSAVDSFWSFGAADLGVVDGLSALQAGDRFDRLSDAREQLSLGDFEGEMDKKLQESNELFEYAEEARAAGKKEVFFSDEKALWDLNDPLDFRRQSGEVNGSLGAMRGGFGFAWKRSELSLAAPMAGKPYGGRFLQPYGPSYYSSTWFQTLFPALPKPGKPPKIKRPWPEEARQLAESLLRGDKLAGLEGGLEITRTTEMHDPRFNELSSRTADRELVSANAWLARHAADGGQTTLNWADAQERGYLSLAYQLGRLRASVADDVKKPALGLVDYSLTSLEQSYSDHVVTVQRPAADRALLTIKHRETDDYADRVLIDTARNVVLSFENVQKGKAAWRIAFDDFVEAGGMWWAQRIENTDAEGRRTRLIVQKVRTLDAAAAKTEIAGELKARDSVQFARDPLPTVLAAKRALETGTAAFDDHLTLVRHFEQSQQWARVMEHLARCEELAAGKPGVRWMRYALLQASRRNEEWKGLIAQEAEGLTRNAEGVSRSDELFLANYLLDQAGSVLQPNEMLALLNTLKPVFERQAGHIKALKSWRTREVNYLSSAGQADKALALWRALATDFSRDYSLQQQYAQALVNAGDFDAAYAWLDRVLAAPGWLAHEEQSLRDVYANFLYQQGRYSELAEFLEAYVARSPENYYAYQRYLSALIQSDQVDKAHGLMAQWLKEAQIEGDLPAPVAARLEAAMQLMKGRGYNLWTNQMDERWFGPLADAALYFARREKLLGHAQSIIEHSDFQRSDQVHRVRKTLAEWLQAEVETAPPAQVRKWSEWVMPSEPPLAKQAWRQIAAAIQKRWSAAPDAAPEESHRKHELGLALVNILTHHGTTDEPLAFLRLQTTDGPKHLRSQYAQGLFNQLLSQPWTDAYEIEAFALLDKLSAAEDADERLASQVGALYRLTDAMLERRYTATMEKVEHQEKLSRTELRDKQLEARRLAREGLSDRLTAEAANPPANFRPWLAMERAYLDVLLARNLKEVEAECWELAGKAPPTAIEGEELSSALLLRETLLNRALTTLCLLATRTQADPALAQRLLAYFDAGIAADAEALHWKVFKLRLLVALDRPGDLRTALEAWIRGDRADYRWRLALGYLLAEQGDVPGAIKLFEHVEQADELDPHAWRTLAGWYLAANRRAEHDRALVQSYKTIEEWQLSRAISVRLNPWQRHDGHLPTELDRQVLLMFAALFEKSNQPQSYVWQLQQFYQACRDFRLLAVLAEGVVGQTAVKVYPFLQGMQPVLTEIRDEATADQLVEEIAKVRERAKTPIDQRALDLLELLVERRAAEVQNQPGPHVERALAAMQRAFERAWSEGEPRLMADLLAGLGRISQAPLGEEQQRELVQLHISAAAGTFDRLHIAHRLGDVRWAYDRKAQASDLLQAALKEFQDANAGVLPATANPALAAYIGYLEGQGEFSRGEQYLAEQLKHPVHSQQTMWLKQRRYELYHRALRDNGQVSFGGGPQLYRELVRRLHEEFKTNDQNWRYQLLHLTLQVYRTAHEKKVPGVVDDLKTFAFRQLPDVLKRQTSNYPSIVGEAARALHDLASPRDGVAFLVERIETEPRWLRYNNQDGWSQHGYTLAHWRTEAKNLGEIEPRLLAIVLAELRRDLETRQQRNRQMYARHHQHYWAEKEADFLRTAEAVYSERKTSGASVRYIADYLYYNLERHSRAIEMMLTAHREKLLNEDNQSRLVVMLHEQKRHGESIPILLPLVELHPTNLQYRVWLMHAYYRTQRRDDLLALLKATDEYFHQEHRWTEGAAAMLAASCLENQLFEQSVAYYEEAIPWRQRTAPRRGIGDGTLSGYYDGLARAYAGLKNTPKAVEAAVGAIVSWGPTHSNRANALEALNHVLRQAPDLDAYVAQLDKQAAETRQENPLVRKAAGRAYFEKQQYAKATSQLRIAAEVQPNDKETHDLLAQSYDKQNDKTGAIEQILAAVELSRRDLALYRDLGRRLAAINQQEEAERAYTSIVEALPSESESHALLAEVRQEQNRWGEALQRWQQVARIRSLEPTGLIKLAQAQIKLEQWEEARGTLEKLEKTSWPQRFQNELNEVRRLKTQVEQRRAS